jgi:hypothetical protein
MLALRFREQRGHDFTRRQPAVNASVTSIWHTDQLVRPTFGRYHREEEEIMGMRKTAIVALIALAGVSVPLLHGVSFAQPAPGAAASAQMASSLSAADKAVVLKKLQDAKQHDKDARKGWSQEPLTQATYDTKIQEINRLMDKLNKGEDFPLSEVEKAVASPHSAPY